MYFHPVKSIDMNQRFYFIIGSVEVLLKIILESSFHINVLNRMEINIFSSFDQILFFFLKF